MNGLKRLKKTKKYIYLISPNRIQEKDFYFKLNLILKLKKISYFQLRIKNYSNKKIVSIGKKIKKICKKHKVKLIINDNPFLVKEIGADGCHIGQSDTPLPKVRKILKKKIIGVTCHNSKKLIKEALDNKADYIAIGAFYSSKTKKTKFKADLNLLKWAKKITKTPIVAIGGINSQNYKKLLLNKANFLAISGYIWNNKKISSVEAVRKLV